MADKTLRTFRGVVEDQPLTHAERRAVIEAPWPAINVWQGKSWGGLAKRDLHVSDLPERAWGFGSEEGSND